VWLMRSRMVLLRRGRRRFRLRSSLALTVMLGLGLGVLAVAVHDPSPVGHFRTQEGRLAYAASYAAAMEQKVMHRKVLWSACHA
jgi:hypothetical protein